MRGLRGKKGEVESQGVEGVGGRIKQGLRDGGLVRRKDKGCKVGGRGRKDKGCKVGGRGRKGKGCKVGGRGRKGV